MPEPASPSENRRVAALLREGCDLLLAQGANPFRADAYRRAAETLEAMDEGVRELFEREGWEGLLALPGVGTGIAAALREILRTGRWSLLERLRGAADPEALFRTIPGVGPELARRLHEELHVDSLEALEVAAHDGRLARVAGIGPRRVAAIRAGLAAQLGRRRRDRSRRYVPVGVLLDVDREYREAAAAGRLPRIAPRRFNPTAETWLPILHVDRDGWHLTALFSNTALAHRLGRTRDWVVIYAYDRDHHETQATVVTENQGALAGRRVVRGREAETRRFYESRGGWSR